MNELIFEAKIYMAPVIGNDFELSLGFFATREEAKSVVMEFFKTDIMPFVGTHLRGNNETFWVVVSHKMGTVRAESARMTMGLRLFG